MASYTISAAVTTAGDAQTINTGDTVTVTSSGSLNGTGVTGVGIYSAATGGATGGFDTISISGTVRGGEYGIEGTGAGGNDTITVNAGGNVFGGYNAGLGAAVYIEGSSNTISNDGSIADNLGGYGIDLTSGTNTINNTGAISASGNFAIFANGPSNSLTNSGSIGSSGTTAAVFFNGGNNLVSNSGTITGVGVGVGFNGGTNSVANSGTISAAGANGIAGISLVGAAAENSNSVTNTGTISATATGTGAAGVAFSGSSNALTNSGTITATAAISAAGVGVQAGSGNIVINKSAGTIAGSEYGVAFATGKSDVVVNRGTIKGAANGIFLDNVTGAHIKVLGNGSITGTSDDGIFATGNSNHVVDKGTISGSVDGIEFNGSKDSLKVGAHGTLSGGDYGIHDHTGVSDHLFNAGTIQGANNAIYFDGGNNHIHNTGNVLSTSSDAIYITAGADRITNKGTIAGNAFGIQISGASNVVTNKSSGMIKNAATAGAGGNHTVFFVGGSNTVTNDGKIVLALHGASGDAAIFAGAGSNTVTNSGVISDYHAGQTSNFAINLFAHGNTVTNTGKIVGTVEIGGSGTNVYDGSHGHLKGMVEGGAGVDTILLGGGHSEVYGGGGADVIDAGSGPDSFIYTDVTNSTDTGYDTVDGFKAGTDTFSFALGSHHALNGLASVTVSSLAAVDATHIEAAVSGHLDPYGAVALTVSSGLYSGDVFLVVDADGDSTFTTGNDYLVVLTHLSGTLSASDILTT